MGEGSGATGACAAGAVEKVERHSGGKARGAAAWHLKEDGGRSMLKCKEIVVVLWFQCMVEQKHGWMTCAQRPPSSERKMFWTHFHQVKQQ